MTSAVDYRGQTTLITGASSGLGVEFARRLAARGSGLVLVARRKDRLEALAEELTAAHGVTVSVIAADLGLPGAGAALAQETARRGLTVTGLINNAGFGTYGPFHESDPDGLTGQISVNVTGLVDIARAFIGPLRAAGRGVLVNVGSTASYQPAPRMAVYAATKAFVLSFTEALWLESAGSGLRVLALSPGPTRTEFFHEIGTEGPTAGLSMQSAEQVVETALRTLDRRNPPPSVVSGRRNHLLSLLPRLTTRRGTALFVGALMNRAARARAAAA